VNSQLADEIMMGSVSPSKACRVSTDAKSKAHISNINQHNSLINGNFKLLNNNKSTKNFTLLNKNKRSIPLVFSTGNTKVIKSLKKKKFKAARSLRLIKNGQFNKTNDTSKGNNMSQTLLFNNSSTMAGHDDCTNGNRTSEKPCTI